MFSLYKKELQSYFLSPAAYAVLAFFTLTFSLTMIMDISAASSLYEFSFTSLFYTNLFYLAILFPDCYRFKRSCYSGKFNLYLCGILSVWSGLHCTGHSDFFFHRIHHSFHHHERSCYHHFAADGQHWYLFLFL